MTDARTQDLLGQGSGLQALGVLPTYELRADVVVPAFLKGGGECGGLIAHKDWSKTRRRHEVRSHKFSIQSQMLMLAVAGSKPAICARGQSTPRKESHSSAMTPKTSDSVARNATRTSR